MLQTLRAGAGSLIAKIILVLLIASFALWGIADYSFNPQDENTAAVVDGQDISLQDLSNAYRQDLVRGNLAQISLEVQQSLNLAQITLDRLINERLIGNEVAKMDLQISDELVAMTIARDPQFLRQDGSFNRPAFESMLLTNGISEADFLANYRMNMAQTWLENSLFTEQYAFNGFRDLVFSYRSKRMDVGLLTIRANADDIPQLPNEADLRAYYTENQEEFRQPDYRDIHYIWLNVDRLAQGIEVDEALLKSEYEARKTRLGSPERRLVKQIRIPSNSTLSITLGEISQALNGGMSLDSLVENGKIEDNFITELGVLSKGDFPDETLADAAFSLNNGRASDPISGLFGEVVLFIEDIIQAQTPSFEDVRPALSLALARQEAIKRLPDDVRLLDDLIGQGQPLEEVANIIGVPLEEVRISRQGMDEAGNLIAVPDEGFLQDIFSMDEGELGFVNQTQEGDVYIARMNHIIKSNIPSFETIRLEVELKWMERALMQVMEAKAQDIKNEIENHLGPERLNLSALATKYGAGMKIANQIDRNGRALANLDDEPEISTNIASAVFALSPGEADLQPLHTSFDEFVNKNQLTSSIGFQIFTPLTIYEGNQADDKALLSTVEDTVRNSFRQDHFTSYIEFLRQDSEIEINQNAINRLYQ